MHLKVYEHVYMRQEVNSNRSGISERFEKSFRLHGNFTTANLEISNPFQKLFRLHGDFTAATFQTIEHVYMRPEVNPNRFEISLRGKISLRCKVTSLFAFT